LAGVDALIVVTPTPMRVTAPVAESTVATAGFELAYTIADVEFVVATGAVNAPPNTAVCAAVLIVNVGVAWVIVMVTRLETIER
jgi:hypothetical protein